MNIKITENAREKIKDAMDKSEFKKPALRIMFAGVGWGGPKLGMALDESDNAKESVINNDDINIILDRNITNIINAETPIVIDYRNSIYGSGFIIDNGAGC